MHISLAVVVIALALGSLVSEAASSDMSCSDPVIVTQDRSLPLYDDLLVKAGTFRPADMNDCSIQRWDCGIWKQVTEPLDGTRYLFTSVGGVTVAQARCSRCGSIRLVRVVDGSPTLSRELLSSEAMLIGCSHTWRPRTNKTAYDRIDVGDVVINRWKGKLYIFRLTVLTDEPRVEFDAGAISDNSPNKLNLKDVKFEKVEAKSDLDGGMVIDYGGRTMVVSVGPVFDGQGQDVGRCLNYYYDCYYGGSKGGTFEVSKKEETAYIAIIHKRYIPRDGVVNLNEFRFKSWEDGLGSRCKYELPPQEEKKARSSDAVEK